MKSKLRELRTAERMSVYRLSAITGVPKLTIARIENNQVKELPIKFLNALCNYYKCGIQDIVYFEEDTQEAS